MAFKAASFGVMPSSMCRSTPSTTTNGVIHHKAVGQHETEERERIDGENRTAGKSTNVPISDTGTAEVRSAVARQPCKKM